MFLPKKMSVSTDLRKCQEHLGEEERAQILTDIFFLVRGLQITTQPSPEKDAVSLIVVETKFSDECPAAAVREGAEELPLRRGNEDGLQHHECWSQ